MCQTVFDTDTKTWIRTLGELADVVGGISNVEGVDYDDGAVPPLDTCLCGYDLPSTLVHAGFVVWQPPNGDTMQYRFRRTPF